MTTHVFHRIDDWSHRHHPLWLDILRIPFGVAIIVKGIMFIHNTSGLVQLMQESNLGNSYLLAYMIAWAHIVGGLFIAIGLATRVSILLQLPIVVGAIVFVNIHNYLEQGNTELGFSYIVFVLLIVYLVEGPGKFSLDAYVTEEADRKRNE